MKKAILISIRPEWVAKILNGEKTIEIRKTAPKCELPIDVYIYCTIGNFGLLGFPPNKETFIIESGGGIWVPKGSDLLKTARWLNGKVVAKFTMKNCVHLEHDFKEYDHRTQEVILESSCLKNEEIKNYAGGKGIFYWEISELQIFDEPKELSDFFSLPETYHHDHESMVDYYERKEARRLKHAPQSWQYVEVEG